jgi:hypothetical protein
MGGAELAALLQVARIPALQFLERLERVRTDAVSTYVDHLRPGKSA